MCDIGPYPARRHQRLRTFDFPDNGGSFTSMAYRCPDWDGRVLSDPVTPNELRKTLKRLGLSQSEAARRLYIDVSTIQRWVAGNRKVPGPAIAALEAWQRQAKAEEALRRR